MDAVILLDNVTLEDVVVYSTYLKYEKMLVVHVSCVDVCDLFVACLAYFGRRRTSCGGGSLKCTDGIIHGLHVCVCSKNNRETCALNSN
jgi:hypothetical protein